MIRNIASSLSEQAQHENQPLKQALVSELNSLSRETDPEIYYHDLLQLGRRFQKNDRPDWAAHLYSEVAGQKEFPKLAGRAQLALDALEGRGEIGARAEVLLSRFSKDIRDPAMILPMMAGTAVAGLVRGSGLSLLASRPAAWYSRGWGARLGVGSLAFAAELPTFVAGGRILRGVQGAPQTGWAQDLASGALSLGAIKLFSLAGKQGLAQIHGVNESGILTRGAFLAKYSHPFTHQAALFGGLMTSHWSETRLGLRPTVDDATAVTDTLASMLSLGAGMRLGTGLLGGGYARGMQEMAWRSQTNFRAVFLPKLNPSQVPLKSALRIMIPLAGLGIFLYASKEGTDHSPHQAMAIGPLFDLLLEFATDSRPTYSGDQVQNTRKAPDARLQLFTDLKERAASLPPAELESARLRAEDFFKKTSFEGLSGNRLEEIDVGLAAMNFLETALPLVAPDQRSPSLIRFSQLALQGPKELAPAALATFKRSLPLIEPADRAAIAKRLRSDLGKSTPKRPAATYFLFAETAAELPPPQRRSELQEILPSLDAHKTSLDEHSLALAKNQQLLRDFISFAERIDGKTEKDMRDRLQQLEGNSGGIFGWFRQRKIDRLREELASPPEIPLRLLLQKFKDESEDPSARHFNLASSILEAREVRELLGQGQPEPLFDSDPDLSIREYSRQAPLREYLQAEPSYFEVFSEQGLRERMFEKLRVQGGYREAFVGAKKDPKGSAR